MHQMIMRADLKLRYLLVTGLSLSWLNKEPVRKHQKQSMYCMPEGNLSGRTTISFVPLSYPKSGSISPPRCIVSSPKDTRRKANARSTAWPKAKTKPSTIIQPMVPYQAE